MNEIMSGVSVKVGTVQLTPSTESEEFQLLPTSCGAMDTAWFSVCFG